MEYDPSGPFITSMLELKLDSATMFTLRPHLKYLLLDFIDLRALALALALASEVSCTEPVKKPGGSTKKFSNDQKVASYAGAADVVLILCFMQVREASIAFVCEVQELLSR